MIKKINIPKATAMLLSVWTFVILLNVISATNIDWTKYRYEDKATGITCSSSENLFIRNDVSDEMACSKICYLHTKCLTSVYQPVTCQCIGCEAMTFQALSNATSVIQFTRRDFNVDCRDIFSGKNFGIGVYEIKLQSSETIEVYCIGSWTVIQRRNERKGTINGTYVSFNESFEAYENGFGDLESDFWLGLRYIREITDIPSELRIAVSNFGGAPSSIVYRKFKLLGEYYKLSIDEHPTDTRNIDETKFPVFPKDNSSRFFTPDRDSIMKCAATSGGGWWYQATDNCSYYNLNGEFGYYFKFTEMMVRRK